ncbi:MAG: hypothetical protein M3Z10_09485 [Gemmatimonadota bacterium]|nr:hypothetical protein [Gemmatimonadota bacterium]
MSTHVVEVAPVVRRRSEEQILATRARALSKAQWQRLLLPIMIATVIVATVAFLALSLYDTWSVRRGIAAAPQIDLTGVLASVQCGSATTSEHERAQCLQWKVAVLLEQQTINRRYHQANVAMLVRVSVKYLGFLTGMLMSLMGAVFVLGRLTEATSKLAAAGPFGKFTIATVSPGLILALLGTILMISTVMVNPPTETTDGNIYLRSPVAQSTDPGGQ